jgi:hypothetical protein
VTEKDDDFNYKHCPVCPELRRKIDAIYLALLGADGVCLTTGVVKEVLDLKSQIDDLKTSMKAERKVVAQWESWVKPVVGGSAVVIFSEILIFALTRHF